MARDTATPDATQDQNGNDVEAPGTGDGTGDDKDAAEKQRIPYERFEEVNNRAKQAERELQEMRDKILEFEDRDKSEVDRERSARERAESQLGDLMNKVTVMEKGAWVRSVAAEMNFHDPEDAVSHLRENLAGLEDQRDAKRIVKKLADAKKHLIREEKKEERRPLGQVFAGQQVPQEGAKNGQPQRTPSQVAAERELNFAQGLSQELNRFRDGWLTPGGGI